MDLFLGPIFGLLTLLQGRISTGPMIQGQDIPFVQAPLLNHIEVVRLLMDEEGGEVFCWLMA